MNNIKIVEGKLDASNLKFVLIASRFNDFIVSELIKGAVDFLIRHGADEKNITIIKVPGAFEIAQVTRVIAKDNQYDGIISLGALIRGNTPHFDLLAAETVKSLAQINLEYGTPIGFGVLTTDNLEQAIERAGTKAGNKGADAASACLEVIRVLKQLS